MHGLRETVPHLGPAVEKGRLPNWEPIHERSQTAVARRRKPFAMDIARAIRLIHETRRKICAQSHVRLSVRRSIYSFIYVVKAYTSKWRGGKC